MRLLTAASRRIPAHVAWPMLAAVSLLLQHRPPDVHGPTEVVFHYHQEHALGIAAGALAAGTALPFAVSFFRSVRRRLQVLDAPERVGQTFVTAATVGLVLGVAGSVLCLADVLVVSSTHETPLVVNVESAAQWSFRFASPALALALAAAVPIGKYLGVPRRAVGLALVGAVAGVVGAGWLLAGAASYAALAAWCFLAGLTMRDSGIGDQLVLSGVTMPSASRARAMPRSE